MNFLISVYPVHFVTCSNALRHNLLTQKQEKLSHSLTHDCNLGASISSTGPIKQLLKEKQVVDAQQSQDYK